MKTPALCLLIALSLLTAAPALALTADEVLRLRQAGVSDETIQKMLEQERLRMTAPAPLSQASPAASSPSPGTSQTPARPASAASTSSVVETQDEVIYRAGQNVPEDIRRMERQEQERERGNREMLRNVIIDTRTPPSPGGGAPGSGQSR